MKVPLRFKRDLFLASPMIVFAFWLIIWKPFTPPAIWSGLLLMVAAWFAFWRLTREQEKLEEGAGKYYVGAILCLALLFFVVSKVAAAPNEQPEMQREPVTQLYPELLSSPALQQKSTRPTTRKVPRCPTATSCPPRPTLPPVQTNYVKRDAQGRITALVLPNRLPILAQYESPGSLHVVAVSTDGGATWSGLAAHPTASCILSRPRGRMQECAAVAALEEAATAATAAATTMSPIPMSPIIYRTGSIDPWFAENEIDNAALGTADGIVAGTSTVAYTPDPPVVTDPTDPQFIGPPAPPGDPFPPIDPPPPPATTTVPPSSPLQACKEQCNTVFTEAGIGCALVALIPGQQTVGALCGIFEGVIWNFCYFSANCLLLLLGFPMKRRLALFS